MSSASDRPFIEISIGDQEAYNEAQRKYEFAQDLHRKNAAIYGLPDTFDDYTEEHREILQDLHKAESLQFDRPPPLVAGRLTFELDPAPDLAKTRENFISLCKGDRGMCKNAPNKPLHYLGTRIHRIVKGFVLQGGDITRGDRTGGESIYGGKFNDAKEGLKTKFALGSIGMANSGKNSNTSGFFIVLTDQEVKLSKLNGKYVCFGRVLDVGEETGKILGKLDEIVVDQDMPKEQVWITTAEEVDFNAAHKPHDNAIEAFGVVLHKIKSEIVRARREWDEHEPRMWSRVQGLTDEELVGGINLKRDLVLVRSGAVSYGTIILGKINVPTNDRQPGYVHVRIHDPPNRGDQDVMFHSIWMNAADPNADGQPQRWEAIQKLDTPLELFNE